jgi:hypothetical protein
MMTVEGEKLHLMLSFYTASIHPSPAFLEQVVVDWVHLHPAQELVGCRPKENASDGCCAAVS